MAVLKPTRGAVTPLQFESEILKGNPRRDPHVREVPVYLPPSYSPQPGRRYPVIYFLTGFTGKGTMLLNVNPWIETLPQRLDRLIAARKLVECIVVMPDCFTSFGGSQYLNSIANGNYEDHLVRELVRYIDRHFRTIPRPEARAIVGKSSGGYGALVQGMRHPDVFGLVGCHSGDMYFELCYRPDFVGYLREIQPFRNAAGFMRQFPRLPNKSHRNLFPIRNTIAMAMAYSPRKTSPPFALPFDERTGEMRADVWREWLKNDPVHMVDRYARNLKKLKLLYLDAGTKDEFNLQYGARIFTGLLRKKRIPYIYEEFVDGHSNIQYRYDRSLNFISRTFVRTAGLRRYI
jgi:enterochelin esterase family protein